MEEPKFLMYKLADKAYWAAVLHHHRVKPGETYLLLTDIEQRLILKELQSKDLEHVRPYPINDGPKRLSDYLRNRA